MTLNQFGALCAMSAEQFDNPRALNLSKWKKRDRNWGSYLVGSEARQSWTGFTWTRTERGWKATGGNTFPYPDDADEVRELIDE